MPVKVTMNKGKATKDFFVNLAAAHEKVFHPLFRSLGDVYVADVQKRIRTQDGGRWVKASKWIRAKTGQAKLLLGAERYVKAVVTPTRLELVGTAPGWTLTQHHEGFRNKLKGPKDEIEDGKVILRLRDGRPLGKGKSKTFAFKPKRAGETPPRKIWPSVEDAVRLGQPNASRFYKKFIDEQAGKLR